MERALAPQCQEKAEGAAVEGVPIFAAAASLVDVDEYAKQLASIIPVYADSADGHLIGLGCPDTDAASCGKYFAISLPAPEGREGSLVFILERQPEGDVIAGLQLETMDTSAESGGWTRTAHPGTGFPEQMWFIPWKAR
ncbi:MAG: hypothetical protein ACM3S1_16385 [Hyphomicrobiales bacterium]